VHIRATLGPKSGEIRATFSMKRPGANGTGESQEDKHTLSFK